MSQPSRIRDVELKTDGKGRIMEVRLVFGPHYFVELLNTKQGVSFAVGATHHGFKADASEVNGELERIVGEVRQQHPKQCID